MLSGMSTRTLVIHTGALGDFLMACPAIEALHRAGPVVLAGSPERHELAVAAGIAEAAEPLDALGLHEVLAAEGARVPERFGAFVAGFDRAVVWMRDPGGVLARAFQAAGVGEVLCRPGLPQATWPGHASAYYLDTLGLPPVSAYRLNVAPEPGLDIVLAPGSGSPRKNWPLAHFCAVADHFTRAGRRVTWLLGPAEEGLESLGPGETLRCPPLPALARQLAGAALFVGNDSGPTHLAALCGCPTIALFGPGGSTIWHPIGPRSQVLGGDGWPSVEAVISEIDQTLYRQRDRRIP